MPLFLAIAVLSIFFYLRFRRGLIPLRVYEKTELPGFPGAIGLIHRLDGADKRHRKIGKSFYPKVRADGQISLPPAWAHKMTAGRLAYVAHLWVISNLSKDNQEAAKLRETAYYKSVIIPFLAALVLVVLAFGGYLSYQTALILALICWAFFVFYTTVTGPTEFRDRDIEKAAKESLQAAGLWPQSASDAIAIERCLHSLRWCEVAGFRRIIPK